MSTTRSLAPKAPATEPAAARGREALVLCGHGAGGGAGVALAQAASIRRRRRFARVEGCALYGAPRLESVLACLGETRIQVLPYLMAPGYTYEVMARRLCGAAAAREVLLHPPLGALPALAGVIRDKARAACRARGWPPARTALLLVGHGMARRPDSSLTATRQAAAIRSAGPFAAVETAFLEQAPAVEEALQGLSAPFCVAVGFFADAGWHGERDVPRLLQRAAGRPLCYAGPIGPEPRLVEPILAALDRAALPVPADGRGWARLERGTA